MVKVVNPDFINPQGRIVIVENVDTVLTNFSHYVFVETTTQSVTVTLPRSQGIGGKQIYIKKVSTPGVLTILPGPGDNIDGLDMVQISILNQSFRLVSDNLGTWACISTSPSGVGPAPTPQPTSFAEITDQITEAQWMQFINNYRFLDLPQQSWFWQDEMMYKEESVMSTKLDIFTDHPSTPFSQSVNVDNGAVEYLAGTGSGDTGFIRSICSIIPDITKSPQIFKLRGGTTSSGNGKRWVLIGLLDAIPGFAASVFVEPSNGIYFLFDDVVANYKAICRSGGVSTETTLSPSFSPTSGGHEIRLVDVSGVLHAQFFQSVEFGFTEVADITTNIPSVQLRGINFLGKYDSTGVGSVGGHVDYMFMGAKR